jgi:hypothetical protein
MPYGIRTSHAFTRFQTFDFNGESSKLGMSENLQTGPHSRHRECFIARGSYIPNQCPSCSGFELFFDSLGDRSKTGLAPLPATYIINSSKPAT